MCVYRPGHNSIMILKVPKESNESHCMLETAVKKHHMINIVTQLVVVYQRFSRYIAVTNNNKWCVVICKCKPTLS